MLLAKDVAELLEAAAPASRAILLRDGIVVGALAVGGYLGLGEDVPSATATGMLSARARSANDWFDILAEPGLGCVVVVGHVAGAAPAGRVVGSLDGGGLEVFDANVVAIIAGHVACAAASVGVEHLDGWKCVGLCRLRGCFE